MELMIAGDFFLGGRTALLLEDDEIAEKVKQAAFVENALEQHLQLGNGSRGSLLTLNGLPGQEPFLIGSERTQAGIEAIGNNQQLVVVEEGGNILFIGLQLIESRPDGGVLIGGILELQHGQRQAVDKNHQVGAAGQFTVGAGSLNGELVDHQPIVGIGTVEIQQAGTGIDQSVIRRLIFDLDAVDQQLVEGVVVKQQGGLVEARNPVQSIRKRSLRQTGVEAREGGLQAAKQERPAVIVALGVGAIAGQLGTKGIGVAQLLEPVEGSLLDDGFGE